MEKYDTYRVGEKDAPQRRIDLHQNFRSRSQVLTFVNFLFEQMMEKHPTEVVRHAVKGMMPNGKLGRQMYKKLKVYAGPEHEHAAQKPEVLDI